MTHHLRLYLVSVLLAAGCAGPAVAEDIRLGDARFTAPDGWTEQRVEQGILFTREFASDGSNDPAAAMIQVVHSADHREKFDANFDSMVRWTEGMAALEPMIADAGETASGNRIRVEYRCCTERNGVSIGQTIAGIAGDTEQLLAGLIFMNVSSDEQAGADESFAALVRSIRFGEASPGPLAPRPDDGGLEGVFSRPEIGVLPNMFGGIDVNADTAILVFDKSGLYSTSIPTQDELSVHCAARPLDCGSYAVTGGGWFGGARTIEMRSVANEYGMVDTEIMPLEMVGRDLRIDGADHFLLPPFAKDTRLAGSWTHIWASSGMGAGTSGSVAVEQSLVLDREGRFTREGWSGATTSAGGVSVSTRRAAQTGTYMIEGYRLVLTPDDGPSETHSIIAPDTGSEALLVINGSNFLKDG